MPTNSSTTTLPDPDNGGPRDSETWVPTTVPVSAPEPDGDLGPDADLSPDNDGRGSPAFQRSKELQAKLNSTPVPRRSPELWEYMRKPVLARAKTVKVPPSRA